MDDLTGRRAYCFSGAPPDVRFCASACLILCLFVLHLCMLVLLFVCLICIKTHLVDFMYIKIAKKIVGFAYMATDDIILHC